ncbi:putative coiled-coil domain-containing protein 144B isoform X2 [Callorhinus ursinus]|uniref:putative coiled-coil domain-containing protein 144B isoform X2 n=1 Tax=Callorhinus ursinus TaxID=34884 RepID=UPI003CD02BA3
MNKKCDREAHISVYSEHPPVQKHEELWIKQGKLEWKNNLKLITSELKRKFGETCQRHKIAPYPKEESLHGNFKEGIKLMEIPSNLTNDRLDCEKKDTFAVPVPLVFRAFPEQKKSSLKYDCHSSSDFSLSENKSVCENDNKPDTELVFNKNKSFKSDTENKKINEEKRRHQSNGTAVFENVCVVAAAAAGLIPQRESGKTENHLFPVGKKEDSDGDPGLHMKEVRKDENEKWTSKVSVITPGLEKADSLTSCPLQVNDESTSGEMDQDEGRPAKKRSHEKKEVKKQMNFMDDLDLTESSASEDSKLPCSNYMSCVSLPAQVGKDCKGRTIVSI